MYRNLPNILTFLRILVIPVIVVAFYFDDVVFSHQLSAALFLWLVLQIFWMGIWQGNIP
jgi:CDP-diacylglycerol--glycerol-3-phosphate 3-phosphatidyltransferase